MPIETKSGAAPSIRRLSSSIHPQGWVPIETLDCHGVSPRVPRSDVAFTPKGGCLLKHARRIGYNLPTCGQTRSIHPQGWVPIETARENTGREWLANAIRVAFTPKGGCPLKLGVAVCRLYLLSRTRSIHPQGWVPIETRLTGVGDED